MHNIQLGDTIEQLMQQAIDDHNSHNAFLLKMREECEALDAQYATLEAQLIALMDERDAILLQHQESLAPNELERAESLARQAEANARQVLDREASVVRLRQSVRQEFYRNELPQLVLEAHSVLNAVTGQIVAGWVQRLRNEGIVNEPSRDRPIRPVPQQEFEEEFEED